MLVNTRIVRIEWGDCDPAGIVYYPRYMAIFDACTSALIERALGMTKYQYLKAYDFGGHPLVSTRARFIIPTRFGDDVTIETTRDGVPPLELRRAPSSQQGRQARGRRIRDAGVGVRRPDARHDEERASAAGGHRPAVARVSRRRCRGLGELPLRHPNSGLPEFGTIEWPKSDISDFGWGEGWGEGVTEAR